MPAIERLKARWRVTTFGVVIILVVFSLTGATVLWLKKPILAALVPAGAPTWVRWAVYPLIVIPLYQVLLLAYGTLFGQFSFFWRKEKAMMRFLARPLLRRRGRGAVGDNRQTGTR